MASDWSMRMSSGPLKRMEKPREASSNWWLLTPMSRRMPWRGPMASR